MELSAQPWEGALKYKSNRIFREKHRFSPDLLFESKGVSFFYTYIRKNASTSFKKLFKAMYPDTCPEEVPTIRCMAEHAKVKGLTFEEIDQRFDTKLFVYRDPIERVFSVYKNKLIQQDGAEDLLRRLEKVVGRDPALLTFDEFVHEYVALLQTERWEEVDGHLYPQVWHLLPITYNKVIRMDAVYQEMRELLPAELCDQVFKAPSNSTTRGSVPLAEADPKSSASYFRDMFARNKALPMLKQVLTAGTEARLREIYASDYRMIAEVEEQAMSALDRQIHYHLSAMTNATVLQFGFNDFSLQLAKALKDVGQGRLLCMVAPTAETEALREEVGRRRLEPFLSVLPTDLAEWPYLRHASENTQSNQWFPDIALESMPELDWVVVGGPDWQGEPFSRYPALPSVVDRLAPEAEVWMLGADDSRTRAVVDQWCADYLVLAELITDGLVYKVRING